MNAVIQPSTLKSAKKYDGFGVLSDSDRTKYWGVSPVGTKVDGRWTVRFHDRINKSIIKFKVEKGLTLDEKTAASIATLFYKDPTLYATSCEPIIFRAMHGRRYSINTCTNIISLIPETEALSTPVTVRQDPRTQQLDFQVIDKTKIEVKKAAPKKPVVDQSSPFASIMAEVAKIGRRITKLKKALAVQ